MYVSSFHFQARVRRTIWHTVFIGDLVLVTCCPFGGGNVGRSVHWYADCSVSVMLRSWGVAIQILVRRADRKTVDQLRLAQQELRQREEELQPERKEPTMEQNIPIDQPPIRDLLQMGRRRWRQFFVFWILEGSDPPNPVSNVGPARSRHH